MIRLNGLMLFCSEKLFLAAATIAIAFALASSAAAQATGTLAGTVKDAHRGS